jgi:hypothetical protein
MPKYMLLLHDDPSAFAKMSPADIQQVIEKYVSWGDRLRAAGILTDGQKLTDEPGKVLRGAGGRMRVTDGPYSETKEVLGGYYVVEADSYEQAAERTKECPHLEYGGTIEVRQIDNMGE